MIKRLLLLLSLLLVCIIGYSVAVHHLQQRTISLPGPIYTVNAGSTAQGLCRSWQQLGQMSTADCFVLKVYLKLHPELAVVKQGRYRVSANTGLFSLLAMFNAGQVAQFSITFIEGETLAQALQRLTAAPYLELDVTAAGQLLPVANWPAEWGESPTSAEALIFPDTYYYTADTKASALLLRAQKALISQLATAWQQRQLDLPLQNPYQLLTLASIIEKESSHIPEKTLVSSVFVNRLRKNMRLQTDPTVIYGLSDFDGDLKRRDLNNPHPYNTYRHAGLPPGPIALVSKTSLLAAAKPAETDLYYFVSKGDGTHQFSATIEQHNAAVKKYIFGR